MPMLSASFCDSLQQLVPPLSKAHPAGTAIDMLNNTIGKISVEFEKALILGFSLCDFPFINLL